MSYRPTYLLSARRPATGLRLPSSRLARAFDHLALCLLILAGLTLWGSCVAVGAAFALAF